MTGERDTSFAPISGLFWRIIWKDRQKDVLEGSLSSEGRLHHSGQKALYISPRPDWAAMAVDAYVRPDDPPRLRVGIEVVSARVLDLRKTDVCTALGVTTRTAGIPWQPQRQLGQYATSWEASDAVRRTEADGLIYPARSYPDRWHVVLHRWNVPGAAVLRETDEVYPWSKNWG